MRHITTLMPSVLRVLEVSALGALSVLAAGAATLWLITGSTDPATWLNAYDHARRCAVADAALSTACTGSNTTVALPAVSVESSPEPTDSPAAPSPQTAPDEPSQPTAPPAAKPPAVSAPAPDSERDDSGEGSDH